MGLLRKLDPTPHYPRCMHGVLAALGQFVALPRLTLYTPQQPLGFRVSCLGATPLLRRVQMSFKCLTHMLHKKQYIAQPT